MISSLRGKVVARMLDGVVLDVNGVGYRVQTTLRALRKAQAKGEVALDTYLHVREDVLQLYGFADPAERELFEHFLSVSGVGPKVALAILSGSTPADLRRAIAWQIATASASASCDEAGGTSSRRIACTIRCTCAFSARP